MWKFIIISLYILSTVAYCEGNYLSLKFNFSATYQDKEKSYIFVFYVLFDYNSNDIIANNADKTKLKNIIYLVYICA